MSAFSFQLYLTNNEGLRVDGFGFETRYGIALGWMLVKGLKDTLKLKCKFWECNVKSTS